MKQPLPATPASRHVTTLGTMKLRKGLPVAAAVVVVVAVVAVVVVVVAVVVVAVVVTIVAVVVVAVVAIVVAVVTVFSYADCCFLLLHVTVSIVLSCCCY